MCLCYSKMLWATASVSDFIKLYAHFLLALWYFVVFNCSTTKILLNKE